MMSSMMEEPSRMTQQSSVMQLGSSTDVSTSKDAFKHKTANQDIIRLLNAFAMSRRLMLSQTRRQYRQPRMLNDDIEKIEQSMCKLLQKMDFQFIRRFSDAQLAKMVSGLKILTKKPDEFVYHKGDISSSIYFVFLGEVDLLGPDAGDPVKRLGACLNFGEAERYGAPRKSSAVAHSYTILGALDRQSYLNTRSEQRVMEDSRVFSTLKRVPPFSALTDKDIKEICTKLIPFRAPARLPVCGNSHDLSRNLIIVMQGTFEIRATILVSRNAHGLHYSGQSLAFSDVPVMALEKGSMWNADLVTDFEDNRDWCNGVEFTHYNMYPRDDGKCLIIPIRELQKVAYKNRLLRRWFESYSTLFRNQKRDSVYQIIAYLCKPDFQSKTSGYMKEIIRSMDEGEKRWKEALRKYEVEILEDAVDFDTVRQLEESLAAKQAEEKGGQRGFSSGGSNKKDNKRGGFVMRRR
ncbi:unnamed protein product [Amoebophrya sp. A25]|nr:unnamed protein product [Amoebophrya sp. A25]|eukprot:GSA25T00013983001.1